MAEAPAAQLESMEASFLAAIDAGQIPGAVVMARDVDGIHDYTRAFGARSVQPDETGAPPPFAVDTPIRIASATKLLTTIMTLQTVEKGVIGLDDSVADILPDLAGMQVLHGFDADGKAIMQDRKGSITPRHLLTHTSGLSYLFLNPLLQEYQSKGYIQSAEKFGIQSRLAPPAIRNPGVEWIYGANLDWAGKLVERTSKMDLEEFMLAHICQPLDIDDMTFKLQQRPDMLIHRADQTRRNKDDGTLMYDDSVYFRSDGEECFGGQGVFCSPQSYMEVLDSLSKNDGRLLKPETVRLMFQPALNPEMERSMNKHMDESPHINYGGPMPMIIPRSFGLGGILVKEDLDENRWRRAGTLTFGGGPNIIWQIDPTARICTLAVYQLEPWNDPICRRLTQEFEKAIYAQLVER